MAKSEVYQIRLDSDEKKQAFAVFKQLGLTPAQAVRMFFKQVVLTQSIPFSIENKSSYNPSVQSIIDENHQDLFLELDQILNKSQK